MKRHTFLAIGMAATMLAPAELPAFELDGEPNAAMIIFGPVNDGGWAQAFNEARERMETDLDMRIPYVDSVPENAASIRPAAELFIERGHNVIIGSAFGFSDTFAELAAEYPDVAFFNGAGTTNADNLQSFYGRTYQSQYLCGMVAGGISETGKLGFVAANPLGLVNWTINGYLMGAREVNPEATLTVVFTGAWNDPAKERAAAEALIEQGIDVIGQHVDTPTPQIVAAEKGVFATGHHRDLREFSEATQCSSVWVWDQFLTPQIQQIAAGEWEAQPFGAFVPMAEGGTDIACCGDAVSEELEKRVMAAREEIVGGKDIFAGPITDNTGTVRVAEGETMSDADLWGMDWFVDGVTAQ